MLSLSARRAWIEIGSSKMETPTFYVALRKESVDRNRRASVSMLPCVRSLSARRAWIEIIEEVSKYVVKDVALRKESVDRNLYLSSFALVSLVALRKESVDRNITSRQLPAPKPRRSPQGERG